MWTKYWTTGPNCLSAYLGLDGWLLPLVSIDLTVLPNNPPCVRLRSAASFWIEVEYHMTCRSIRQRTRCIFLLVNWDISLYLDFVVVNPEDGGNSMGHVRNLRRVVGIPGEYLGGFVWRDNIGLEAVGAFEVIGMLLQTILGFGNFSAL